MIKNWWCVQMINSFIRAPLKGVCSWMRLVIRTWAVLLDRSMNGTKMSTVAIRSMRYVMDERSWFQTASSAQLTINASRLKEINGHGDAQYILSVCKRSRWVSAAAQGKGTCTPCSQEPINSGMIRWGTSISKPLISTPRHACRGYVPWYITTHPTCIIYEKRKWKCSTTFSTASMCRSETTAG